ncbi:MAG: glucose-1-phosphate adenylyltransferase subunit GlgD [bacterium]
METLALILAGGRGSRLDILSERRSKPAVPFAGKFRIIDFVLSNCCNSGIYQIGILTQYLPLSLNEHIGVGKPWDLDRRDSSISLLQPHNNWYEGTADAVKKNIEFIKRNNPKRVLILSGDHIYKMDYSKLIKEHENRNADVTIAAKIVDLSEANRFGILESDDNNKIYNFIEKPEHPTSNKASMGIYLFNTEVLLEALNSYNISDLDFGNHIIPDLIKNKNVYSYDFNDYWKDVGTYDSYLECNLELANASNSLDLYHPSWKIYTKSEDLAPVKFGDKATVNGSLISNGSVIDGTLENCVLSPGVVVNSGCLLKNCVILNNVIIGKNCVIENTVIDKDVNIGDNCIIGFGTNLIPNEEIPGVLSSGINIIGKNAKIPSSTTIMRNCRICSSSTHESFNTDVITSGSTIR